MGSFTYKRTERVRSADRNLQQSGKLRWELKGQRELKELPVKVD